MEYEEIMKTIITVSCSIIIAIGGVIVAFIEKQKRKILNNNHNKLKREHIEIKKELRQEKLKFKDLIIKNIEKLNNNFIELKNFVEKQEKNKSN